MSEHIVPPKVYYMVFAALIALTATTTAVAFVDLGVFNPVVALVIAVIKGLLVILFFMHVRYSTRLTAIILVAAFFWLGILLFLTLNDYFARNWIGGMAVIPQLFGR